MRNKLIYSVAGVIAGVLLACSTGATASTPVSEIAVHAHMDDSGISVTEFISPEGHDCVMAADAQGDNRSVSVTCDFGSK